jgi:hypothetical protein
MSSGAKKRLQKIRETEIGNTGKKVLLVEGEDDVNAYRTLLTRQFPRWEDKWIVTHANGKQKVIDILKASNEPTWLGLIDHDEWKEERILQEQEALPNLLILPRFCLENYLICPDELWEALPANQQAKIPEGLSQLKTQILKDKNQWVRHGVLWSIINPLWDGIVELGFKDALLDFDNAQDDQKIKDTLKRWHDFFEPEKILVLFQERLSEVMAKNEAEQLKRWIHGKKFYREHVHQTLNQFLGQEDAEARKTKIFKSCPLPNDLDFVYQRMRLFEL